MVENEVFASYGSKAVSGSKWQKGLFIYLFFLDEIGCVAAGFAFLKPGNGRKLAAERAYIQWS